MTKQTGQRSKENRRGTITERIKKVPLFWRYLLMIGGVLAIAFTALMLVNQRYLDTLSEKMITEMQTNLEHDCEKLNEKIYSAVSLPYTIEYSRYFRYLIGPKEEKLKFYPVLDMMQKALQKQMVITSDSEDTLLYFRKYNCIIGTAGIEPVAEDFFDSTMIFSETSMDEIMKELQTRTGLSVLPMQKVKRESEVECLSFILRPGDSSVSVISIYSKEVLLDRLGINNLPEGSYWEFVDSEGRLLASSGNEYNASNQHLLVGELSAFQIRIRVGIPERYFRDVLRSPRRWSIVLIGAAAVICVAAAIFLSRLSVRPIRRLIRVHGTAETKQQTNELLSLDSLISTSKANESKMKLRLIKQIFAKVFYEGILSEEEESQIAPMLPSKGQPFETAIFYCSPEINAALGQQFERLFPESIWTMLSPDETGLLLKTGSESRFALTQFVHQMNLQLGENGIRCGVSLPGAAVFDLYATTRQARRALPLEPGIAVYREFRQEYDEASWLWHKRLYHCILNEDKDGALRLLDQVTSGAMSEQSEEMFYIIRYTLRHAASDLGVQLSEKEELEYFANLSMEGNLRNLGLLIRRIFDEIHSQKEREKGHFRKEVLNRIRESLQDSELTVSSVAFEMGMSENSVYETVRNLTGKTFKEYLTDLRMERASELLCSTNKDVSEVTALCGFSNSSTFYRQFQAYFGISPGMFRKSGEGSGRTTE